MNRKPTGSPSNAVAASARREILAFYAQPAAMSAGGRHATALAALPDDLASLVRIVQGLALHEFVASPMYGVDVPDERRFESHIRPMERMLDRVFELDGRPMELARPPERRLVGVCHHFALLLVGMLRAKGIAARARWGFGAYFNPPYFEDHVLCEVWRAAEARWALVEAQLDDVWRSHPGFDIDILDVPRDRFLIAAEAWTRCRTGQADPARFGIFEGNQRGLWFIACSLLKDAAALGKTETLPWDVWGAMPHAATPLDAAQLAFFDRLATLTKDPDASFAELMALCENDPRVRVPPTVFNAVRQQPESFL